MKPQQLKNKTKGKSKACLNLRQIQEERQALFLRSARGLVDLTEKWEIQRKREAEEGQQARARAIKNAKNLLDLSRKKVFPVQVANLPRKVRPCLQPIKVKVKPKFQVQPESIKQKKSVSPASVPKVAKSAVPLAPLVDEMEKTFPEYFEVTNPDQAISVPVDPNPKVKPKVSSPEFTVQQINFLDPAFEIARNPAAKRVVQPQKVAPNLAYHPVAVKKFRKRSFVVFVIAVILLTGGVGASASVQRTLDSQDEIFSKATEGATSLRSAAGYLKQQNFLQAVTDFERAAQYFSQAEKDINDIGQVTSQLLTLVPQGKAAVALVRAGQAMSESGQSFAKAVGYFRQVGDIFADVDFEANSEKNLNLAEALLLSKAEFDGVVGKLAIAEQNIGKVDADMLPADFRDEFTEAQEVLRVLTGATAYFQNFADQIAGIIGADGPKRYLVFFANSDEMRGSIGGFPGSYMVLDFADGKIKSLEFKDVYEIRGQQEELIAPPKQFQLITGNWEAHDVAGWPIDYSDSANKVMDYYQLSGVGTTVDGVWTINSDIIPNLLAITGPIELKEFDITVTENNYLTVLENEVESDEARQTGEPKKIVEKLMDKILTKIFSQKRVDWLALMGTISKAISEKEILLYFTDSDLQEFALANNAAGNIKDADDYLSVFSYNIGGGKTDKDISEEIQQVSGINGEGDFNSTVTITRQHRLQRDLDELSNIKNVSWIKTVLPKNAKITQVSGEDNIYPIVHLPSTEARLDEDWAQIESAAEYMNNGRVMITEEADKKVVGFWMGLEPGTKRTVEIKYTIPDVMDLTGFLNEAVGFTSVFQTQPGKENSRVSSRISFPEKYSIAWQEASGAFVNNYGDSLSWTTDNPSGDIVVSVVVDR